ncbi:MAG: hypothetical protein IH624_11740 [Phycisphaerae bacterium]|nr:hypothetical protein [Phycisphaerae bacterium]
MKPGKAVILVMIVCAVGLAQGDLIVVGVEGVVQRSNLAGVSVGSTMTGYCVYDTTKPDTMPESYLGKYELDELVMTIGEYRFEHWSQMGAEPAWFSVWTTDVTYLAQTNTGLMLRNDDTVGPPTLWVKLIDVCNAHTSGPDAFPSSFPDNIGFFSWRNEWQVYNGMNHLVSGKLTAISIIPEPASVCLLLVGAICLRKRVSRNQQGVG